MNFRIPDGSILSVVDNHDVFTVVLRSKAKLVAAMFKAIHAQEDMESAKEKVKAVVIKLREMKLPEAAKKVE